MRTPRARQERSPSAIRILRAALLSWVALRAVAAFVPGTWLWGLNSLRFSAPALGWSLWAAAALALVPSLARGLVPALSAAGDAIAAGGTSVRVAAALAAALLVVLLQDRTYFLGDALLRLGAANVLNDPGVLAPGGAGQVLPLDVLLHYQLPRAFVVAHLAAPIVVSRALGAVEAALFAVLSIELARALQLRGVAAAAVAAVSFFCGALLLFSGYDKSYTEMCVVTAAVGVCALRVARGDGGLVPLGLAATAGALLHRTALALAPAVLLAWWMAFRAHRGKPWRWFELLAIAIPVAAAVWVLPSILKTVGVLDVRRHLVLPHAGTDATGGMRLDVRVADLISFVLLTSPLALAVPVLLPGLRRDELRRTEFYVLLSVAVPFVALLLALRGQEGMYRDWDVFAACGVALSLLTAWTIGRALRPEGPGASLGVAVVMAVACPAIEWLALSHETDRGLNRVETFVSEPPPRPDPERAATWDHLGSMRLVEGRFDAATTAFAHAVQVAPSPRLLHTLGLSLVRAGRPRDAQAAFRAAVRRDSTALSAWMELRDVSLALGDLGEAGRAARKVAAMRPEDPDARRVVNHVDSLAAPGIGGGP